MELLIADNPDPDSKLLYLLRLPLGGGMVFRTSGTWPRTKALFCYPVALKEWPAEPHIVERVPLRSCIRRGAAIDRSSTGRGRTAPSLCSPPRAVASRCSGSRRGPANRPGPTCAPRPPAPRALPSWRSSSTRTSNTPTGSPTNRSETHISGYRDTWRSRPTADATHDSTPDTTGSHSVSSSAGGRPEPIVIYFAPKNA